MPPKKRKPTEDIRSFFNKKTVSPGGSSSTESSQPGEASTSQMDAAREVEKEEVEEEEQKEEDDAHSKGRHSHKFTVKFPNKDKKYLIHCEQPRTVLDAIESRLKDKFKKKSISVSKIIIQRGKKVRTSVVATHFPCSCIKNKECLVIHCRTEEVQKSKRQHDRILSRDEYSVFYISKKGGDNMIAMKLLRSNPLSKIDYLCVYAKKGTSVKEALKQDGRFVDLDDFELTKDEKSDTWIDCKLNVDILHHKKFKICRDRKSPNYANDEASSGQQGQPSTSKQSKQKVDTKSVLAEAQKSGISVKQAMEETGSKVNIKVIRKLLCEQFQDLKTWMESRFPGNSYQKALALKKENFGKIQQSFNEVHRVRELLKLGESVCLLKFNGSQGPVQGTGFLLFDNFILTNAHSFKMCTDLPSDQWKDHVKITGMFNYENPDSNKIEFTAKLYGGCDIGMDYAILELNLDNQTQAGLPEGLLSRFAPPPVNGEACLIGHPAGKVKQIDPTCIITKEEREQAVDQNLEEYRDYIITLCAIKQGIKNDPYADVYVTYNTFMYHGASGSPVFDANGGVFGLHSGGFFFGVIKPKESVIEFAHPLLTMFKNFVEELKKSGQAEMLVRVQVAGKGNPYLEQIIK